jgi:uncharacterized RDD family membrane protein YckC
VNAVATDGRQARAVRLQGTRAGVVSRLLAALVDAALVFLVYVIALWAVAIVRALGTEHHVHQPQPDRWVTVVVLVAIAVAYLTAAWSASGRTPGDQLFGLRVVTLKGTSGLSGRRALARGVLCATLGWLGLVWLVGSRRNLALHDRWCGTAVVYEWIAVEP